MGPVDDGILAVIGKGTPGDGAVSHGDAPLGGGHLFPEGHHHRGHLFRDGSGHDHDIRLARGGAENPGPETIQVKTGHAGGHHFNGAAGNPEGHGPKGGGPGQVQDIFQQGEVEFGGGQLYLH